MNNRYEVYPVVGDQCQFDETLHAGNDKVVASLAAKRTAKHHPLGVILIDRRTGNAWLWREQPPLNGHPVEVQLDANALEQWATRHLRQRRQ